MIKFLAHKDGKPFFGFGLTPGNCERLVAGRPILVDLDVMCRDVPPSAMRGAMMIFGGKTEADMVDDLRRQKLVDDETTISPIQEHQAVKPYTLPEQERGVKQLVGPNVKSFTVGEWCSSPDGTGPATAVGLSIETEKHGDLVMRLKSAAEVDRLIEMLKRHKKGVWPDAK